MRVGNHVCPEVSERGAGQRRVIDPLIRVEPVRREPADTKYEAEGQERERAGPTPPLQEVCVFGWPSGRVDVSGAHQSLGGVDLGSSTVLVERSRSLTSRCILIPQGNGFLSSKIFGGESPPASTGESGRGIKRVVGDRDFKGPCLRPRCTLSVHPCKDWTRGLRCIASSLLMCE
jgi:hypothetical protein